MIQPSILTSLRGWTQLAGDLDDSKLQNSATEVEKAEYIFVSVIVNILLSAY